MPRHRMIEEFRKEGVPVVSLAKRIEEVFSWIKTTAGQARTRLRGIERVRWSFTLTAAAYNLVRLPKLARAA